MKRVCIGIQIQTEPARLRPTLDSLHANTRAGFELLLLPDGPDEATEAALLTIPDLPRSPKVEPRGGAACFNRLAAESDAEVIVLLESGTLVSPGWLDSLLAALAADPRNGLAGPTTNLSWNEQGVYSHCGSTPEEIARTARDAAARFGHEARVLTPLHSLADFCYAVGREVINEIGLADEDYGSGPCWEMDYNIRAARAGWRGVWACAAYVHRAPMTARRRLEEERRFAASKQRYQDKFCGARLRGEKNDYRAHCRGDACSNFAPAALIEIKLPGRPAAPEPQPASAQLAQDEPRHELRLNEEPLVSCIMPTCNRRPFIPQALRCFRRQDYPRLELIVVDDGTDAVADCLPDDPRIRYFRPEQKLTIGAKRNFACRQARGEFIVHWDDDDWYPAERVRSQIAALRTSGAEVCGSSRIYFFDPAAERAWEYHYNAAAPVWVGGSTLAYRREVWERSPFPDLQVGEDAHFVCNGSKNIHDLNRPELCVALVHAGNTSAKETGGVWWRPHSHSGIQQLLGDDWEVYRALTDGRRAPRWPLISCIMPTYQRRTFIPLALRCFQGQDYPNKELIVVDDGADAVADLVAGLPGVHYVHLPARASIGAKRNLACEQARGEIIAHWDDDDWYAPNRLHYQAAPLLAGEAEITGLVNTYVLELPQGKFWTTQPELHRSMFVGDVHGGTLVYRRAMLDSKLRYPEVNLAEDAWLLHYAMASGQRLRQLANPGVFVYVRHGANAWQEFAPGSFLNPAGWEQIPPPLTFPADILRDYQSAVSLTA